MRTAREFLLELTHLFPPKKAGVSHGLHLNSEGKLCLAILTTRGFWRAVFDEGDFLTDPALLAQQVNDDLRRNGVEPGE
jgi:hypothetical protein